MDTLSKHQHLIELMHRSGLKRIQIGVKSGDQQIIDLYKKEITLEEVVNTVRKLEEVGVMSIYTNFIIGGAGETEESFLKSLKFMVELMYLAPGRMECGACYLSPYPGTDINNNPEKYNIEFLDREMLTGTSLGGVFVETRDVDADNIKKFKHKFVDTIFGVMNDILPKLSSQLIREHLVARSASMATLWSDFFLGDKILSTWFNYYDSGEYSESLISVNSDLDYIFPVRCFSSDRVIESQLNWSARAIKLEFSEIEECIVNHCSGKLSLYEIAQLVYVKYGSDETFSKVLEDIVIYVNELSKELLIINRELR